MTTTRYHMCLNIAGFMRNAVFPRDYDIFQHDDGRKMAPGEARAFLLDELEKGHRVIPAGKCDNFDPQDGCQGHKENTNDSDQAQA